MHSTNSGLRRFASRIAASAALSCGCGSSSSSSSCDSDSNDHDDSRRQLGVVVVRIENCVTVLLRVRSDSEFRELRNCVTA